MRIFRPGQPDGLTKQEMRSALRAMNNNTRNEVIRMLNEVGCEEENGWAKLVVPFIEETWPKEQEFSTSSSATFWVCLLHETGDSFTAVYAAVKRFLAPVEIKGYLFYRFNRECDDEQAIAARFPEEMLDLAHTVTPEAVTQQADELQRVLDRIAESDPSLASDERFLRLTDVVEGS